MLAGGEGRPRVTPPLAPLPLTGIRSCQYPLPHCRGFLAMRACVCVVGFVCGGVWCVCVCRCVCVCVCVCVVGVRVRVRENVNHHSELDCVGPRGCRGDCWQAEVRPLHLLALSDGLPCMWSVCVCVCVSLIND